MTIKEVRTDWAPNQMKQNSYVVELNNCAVMIDAGCPLKTAKEQTNLPIEAVFITHCHLDHVQYIEEYDKAGIKIYGHNLLKENMISPKANATEYLGCPKQYNVKEVEGLSGDGELILDNTKINYYSTPGHTKDGISFLIDNALFSGDTLFSVAIGRTDLFGADKNDMISSLNKLDKLQFKDLYAGHGRPSNKDEQNENIKKWLIDLNNN